MVKVYEYTLINIIITIFIIVVGKAYIKDDIIPLKLKVKINAEIEKPIINPLRYVKKIFAIIPIIEAPNTHIKIINIKFSIREFLKASKLFNLFKLILFINSLIFVITNSLSLSFKITKNNDPDIIPSIIIKITNKFIRLFGSRMLKKLFNLFFIYYHHLSILKRY